MQTIVQYENLEKEYGHSLFNYLLTLAMNCYQHYIVLGFLHYIVLGFLDWGLNTQAFKPNRTRGVLSTNA